MKSSVACAFLAFALASTYLLSRYTTNVETDNVFCANGALLFTAARLICRAIENK